jgi:pimeloyl-ACP methyl ester carboxylesterase
MYMVTYRPSVSANKFLLIGLLVFASVYFWPEVVEAETSFSGHVTTDTTWTTANSPYLLTSEVVVDAEATLTIEPGVTIKSGNSLTIHGRLDARGTPESPISFTSDDIDPVVGGWHGLWFMEGSEGALAYFEVRHGGYHQFRTLTGHKGTGGGIYNTGGNLDISSCLIQNNNYFSIAQTAGTLRVSDCDLRESRYGVIVTGGDATIEDSNFIDDWSGIYLTGEGNMTLRHNRFDVDFEAIFFDAATVTSFAQEENIIDAAQYLGVIVGSPVSNDQTWSGGALPYIFKNGGWNIGVARMKLLGNSYLDVSAGTALTLGPGTVVKNLTTSSRVIAGTIDAKGTKEEPVIFTSLKDDSDGRDTNNDGDTTSPGVGDWSGFTIGAAGTLLLDHARVHFASVADDRSGISNVGGTVRITNSKITQNGPDGIENHDGTMVINNSEISGDQVYGVLNHDTEVVDARNNYWGDPTGPRHPVLNPSGLGRMVSDNVDFFPWLMTPPGTGPTCCSSVLLLPGIMGSSLYEGEDKRWEPGSEADVERLYLDAAGKSVNQIAARGVIETFDGPAIFNFDLYESFLADLEDRKQNGFLDDYVAYGYDWRLSLPDILGSGDLQDEVRELALGSKSKKVTIVAHSNGGLLAKALVNALGPEAANLIDQVVLVGVPQIGTPQALGALLHGYNSGILTRYSDARARDFARNAPFAYQLLPQPDYFDNAGFSVFTPLVRFAEGGATNSFVEAYGTELSSADGLQKFLRGDEGRSAPEYADLSNPLLANSSLLQDSLDVLSAVGSAWQPPAGVKVHQVAGTGEPTVAGIEYWTDSKCIRDNFFSLPTHCDRRVDQLTYSPVLVYDGDHTVIEPSALAMSTSSESVSRWWVDLSTYNDSVIKNNISVLRTNHKDLLEISDVRDLILDNLIGTSTSANYQYVFGAKPELNKAERLTFTLHSPLSLSYTESDGLVVDSDHPAGRNSEYNRYGEVQMIVVYDNKPGVLNLHGESAGSFTLEIAQFDGEQIEATTTLSAIPTSTTTVATLVVNDGTISGSGPLDIDYDGNGSIDLTMAPAVGERVTLPDEPVAEPTVAELVSQFKTYVDANLVNKSVRKLLQKQIDAFYKIYRQREQSAGPSGLLASLTPFDSALRLQLKALDKQVSVYLKLKKISSDNAMELRRLLSLIESQL